MTRGLHASCTTRPGQALTSILLGLKPLEQLVTNEDGVAAVTAVRELVVSTLQDVRRLAVEPRPSALDDFGLVAAVERLAATFREQSGIEVDLETGLGDGRLPAEVETALYRIVQEALTNVVKHAGARRVSILLTRQATRVVAIVEDDGHGFDEDLAEDGLGLVGMRERVGLVGGLLRIESAPGSGRPSPLRCRSAEHPILIVDGHAVVADYAACSTRSRTSRPSPRRPTPTGVHLRGDRAPAGHRADGRDDAGHERDRGAAGTPAGGSRRQGADALDAGRPALRARGVRSRREWLRARQAGDTDVVGAIRAVWRESATSTPPSAPA